MEDAVEVDHPIPSFQRHRHRLADRAGIRLGRLAAIVPRRQRCGGGEVSLFGFGVGAEVGAGADPERVVVQERDLWTRTAARVSVARCASRRSCKNIPSCLWHPGTHVPLEVGRPRLSEAELDALQRPGDARHEIPDEVHRSGGRWSEATACIKVHHHLMRAGGRVRTGATSRARSLWPGS